MRTCIWLGAMALVVSAALEISPACGQEGALAPQAIRLAAAKDEGKSAAEALRMRIDVAFREMPLKDAVDAVSAMAGVPFYLNAKKLEEAGVNIDTPITSTFKNIRLGTWLDIFLAELELTHYDKDNLIVITTPEDAESNQITHIYDCRDLLALPPAAHERALPAEVKPAFGAAPSGGPESTKPATDPASRLMALVMNSVDPQSWAEVGGPGSIGEYRGMVVVSQTERTHQKVASLLDMLRQASDLPAAKAPRQ